MLTTLTEARNAVLAHRQSATTSRLRELATEGLPQAAESSHPIPSMKLLFCTLGFSRRGAAFENELGLRALAAFRSGGATQTGGAP